jgi:hypothetical protein
MSDKTILGIRVLRSDQAGFNLQTLLSNYGGIIRTRLGLNEVIEEYASPEGIVLLELCGDQMDCQRLENELLSQDNLDVQKMVFKH